MTYSIAAGDTFAEAARLLDANHLPVADLREEAVTLIVAHEAGALLGCIGLEQVGASGFLRSLVVDERARGQGLAHALYERLDTEARRRGYPDLYCLTTSADGFFQKLGFTAVPRDVVPDAIRATPQFTSLCPSSTRVYRLPLSA